LKVWDVRSATPLYTITPPPPATGGNAKIGEDAAKIFAAKWTDAGFIASGGEDGHLSLFSHKVDANDMVGK
jgi:hypothetical protein